MLALSQYASAVVYMPLPAPGVPDIKWQHEKAQVNARSIYPFTPRATGSYALHGTANKPLPYKIYRKSPYPDDGPEQNRAS